MISAVEMSLIFEDLRSLFMYILGTHLFFQVRTGPF